VSGREAEVVAAEGAHLSPGAVRRGIPPDVWRAVRHVVTLRPAGSGFELTGREFGSAGARDISRAGLEQCLDKMELLFRRTVYQRHTVCRSFAENTSSSTRCCENPEDDRLFTGAHGSADLHDVSSVTLHRVGSLSEWGTEVDIVRSHGGVG
jgi:hypothetical protein